MQDYLSAMSALQIDSKLINKIKAAYIIDVAYSHGRTPNGVRQDETDDLYYMADKPTRKFRQRYIGPYPVTAKISSQAYHMRLPPTFHCHNVFHIRRLRRCVNPYARPDAFPSSVEPPVDEFALERVLDFSIERREDLFKRGLCLAFLVVRWLNYDSSHDNWEPYSASRRVEVLHDLARASRHLQDTLRCKELPANLPTCQPASAQPSRFQESIAER
eukprot:jgi/Tetstr1/438582/TSEL_027133.t1